VLARELREGFQVKVAQAAMTRLFKWLCVREAGAIGENSACFLNGVLFVMRRKVIDPDLRKDRVVISRLAISYERKANLITPEAKMYELCNLCIDSLGKS